MYVFAEMSEHMEQYNGLQNTAKTKSRYREKLQTVGLTIDDDHTSLRITRTISLTTCLCGPSCGPKLSTGTYLLTLLNVQPTAALVMEKARVL